MPVPTTAALEYAYRHIDHYQIIWMFHAEDATALLTQFHDLAELIDPADPFNQTNPVLRCHAALARVDVPWLLIFDNLPDHAAARHWLPPKGKGHVLVTTQDGHWARRQAVEVDTLTTDAAATYLLNRAREHDTDSAHTLARQLGELPLALAQAAAYIETTGRTIAEYLQLLQDNRARLLSRAAPTNHTIPVVATWSIALEKLHATNPASVTLLRLASCLAPEAIPHRLLLNHHNPPPDNIDPDLATQIDELRQDSLALDDAVAGLRRHSLIGPPGEAISIHRLVQAVTLDQLDGQQQQAWRNTTAALVEAAVPKDVSRRDAWTTCVLLLPHAHVLEPSCMAMTRLAAAFGHAGDYATAKATWNTIANARTQQLGAEHPDTFSARAHLAVDRRDGRCGARPGSVRRCYRCGSGVSGVEHPDTLSARTWLVGPGRRATRPAPGTCSPAGPHSSGR